MTKSFLKILGMLTLLTVVFVGTAYAQDGRCCYGDPSSPTCEMLTESACSGKLTFISWYEGLDCTTSCSTEDTIMVELVQEYPTEWAYNTDSNSTAEIYVTSNRALKAASLNFFANRRVIKIDSVKLSDVVLNIGGFVSPQVAFRNDTVFTATHDTMTYFTLGAIQFSAPPNIVIPYATRSLLGTCWYHLIADSIGPSPKWGDEPIEFWWDSTYIPPAGDFTFTRCDGQNALPTDIMIDTTTGYVTIGVSDINPGVLPAKFELTQNYPNPFNPDTKIEFAVPQKSQVDLVIYNVMGQKVKTLVSGVLDAGWKQVTWDGTDDYGNIVASGIYLYKLNAGDYVDSKKMSLLK